MTKEQRKKYYLMRINNQLYTDFNKKQKEFIIDFKENIDNKKWWLLDTIFRNYINSIEYFIDIHKEHIQHILKSDGDKKYIESSLKFIERYEYKGQSIIYYLKKAGHRIYNKEILKEQDAIADEIINEILQEEK
tara:strand:- start:14567 stop:14968 length:402 start_codon:yes stop_codon:yes gene_type:complete